MKLIRYLILIAFIGAAVLVMGMVTQGWKVGGYSWKSAKEQFLPTKKAFVKRQDTLLKRAEQEAEGSE